MMHFSCDGCGRRLDPEYDVRYVIRMEVYASLDPNDGEFDDDRDHLQEIQDILEQLEEDGYGSVSFADDTAGPGVRWLYKVRAFNASGESNDSNVFEQNLDVVWSNPGRHALLHNWNETIGLAGSGGQGYHKGCDIQQVGNSQDTIVIPRGGIVARTDVGALAGQPILAFAGIAHPERFFNTLRQSGIELTETASFNDHHFFDAGDAEQLLARADALGARLITTEKDHVRLLSYEDQRGELARRTVPFQISMALAEADRPVLGQLLNEALTPSDPTFPCSSSG